MPKAHGVLESRWNSREECHLPPPLAGQNGCTQAKTTNPSYLPTQFPTAFHIYSAHCKTPRPSQTLSQHQNSLLGTTLLIPPSPDPDPRSTNSQNHTGFWVACLFTSASYGRAVAPAAEILLNTQKAVEHLTRQIEQLKRSRHSRGAEGHANANANANANGPEIGPCYAVRLNSGSFGVQWARTKAILEQGNLDMTIVTPALSVSTTHDSTVATIPRRKRKAADPVNPCSSRRRPRTSTRPTRKKRPSPPNHHHH